MKLWLDDERDPAHFGAIGWEWAKTAQEAIRLLQSGQVEEASLDHDLGDGPTGYEVVCWMEYHKVWPPKGVRVHSLNPVGRERMRRVIAKHYEFCIAPNGFGHRHSHHAHLALLPHLPARPRCLLPA